MIELKCKHKDTSQKKLLFLCEIEGNYTAILCKNCEEKEDMKFLIKEITQ